MEFIRTRNKSNIAVILGEEVEIRLGWTNGGVIWITDWTGTLRLSTRKDIEKCTS